MELPPPAPTGRTSHIVQVEVSSLDPDAARMVADGVANLLSVVKNNPESVPSNVAVAITFDGAKVPDLTWADPSHRPSIPTQEQPK